MQNCESDHEQTVKAKRLKLKRGKKIRKRLCHFIRDFDRFGTPIPLNYQGSDTFKTVPGSILSLVAFFFLGLGLFRSLKSLVEREDWSLKEQAEITSFDELNMPLDLNSYPNFHMGFELKLSDEAGDLGRSEYLKHGRLLMKYFSVNEIGYSQNSQGFKQRKDKPQNNFLAMAGGKMHFLGHSHPQEEETALNSQNYLEYKIDLNRSIISGSESYHADITNNYVTFVLSRDILKYMSGIERACRTNTSCSRVLQSDTRVYNDLQSFFMCTTTNKTEASQSVQLLNDAYSSPELWQYFRFLHASTIETLDVPDLPKGVRKDHCSDILLRTAGSDPKCSEDGKADGEPVSSRCLLEFQQKKLDKELNLALRYISIKPVVYDEISNFKDGANEYPFQQRKIQSSAPKRKQFPLEEADQAENFKFILRKSKVCLDNDLFAEFRIRLESRNKCDSKHDFEVMQVVDQRLEFVEPEGEVILAATLVLDNQFMKTEIRSYKFYDVLADNGGFFEALLSLFALVGNPLSRLTFRYSVAKEAFYTRKNRKEMKGQRRSAFMQGPLLDYSRIKELFSRVKFSWLYRVVDPFFGTLIFPCWCRRLYREKRLVNQANDRFEDELNVITLLKKIRLSTDLWTQALSLDQKKTLKYSANNVLVQKEDKPWAVQLKKLLGRAEPKKKKRPDSSASSFSFSVSSMSDLQSSSSDFEQMKRDFERRDVSMQRVNTFFGESVLRSVPLPRHRNFTTYESEIEHVKQPIETAEDPEAEAGRLHPSPFGFPPSVHSTSVRTKRYREESSTDAIVKVAFEVEEPTVSPRKKRKRKRKRNYKE